MSDGAVTYPLVALIILDGWGIAPAGPGNAVHLAHTPVFDRITHDFPHTQLSASGVDVGLPDGQIGNSEVGHLNLGGGRVVLQDLPRINLATENGDLARNPRLQDAIQAAKSGSGTFHIIGLASTGGVHSHLRHIEAIADAAARADVPRVAIHAITDGRDAAPDGSLTDMPQLQDTCARLAATTRSDVRIATVVGRFFAMDRDRRWDRIQRAYNALVGGQGEHASTAVGAVRDSQAAGVTDEFVEPTLIGREDVRAGADPWTIHDGDSVVFANFRPDRARELAHAITDPDFSEFERGRPIRAQLTTMTKYDDVLTAPVLFDPQQLTGTLADAVEAAGWHQLHEAETEKYAHVTYFFNGGVEREHADEQRVLVPSNREVKTYDEAPEMSAATVAERFCATIQDEAIRFAVVNFANPDMVGHTGSIPATVTAVETVDALLADVLAAVEARGGVGLVTADHGNAEELLTADGKPLTSHTVNPVPLVVTLPSSVGVHPTLRSSGRLGDVAPTVLHLLGLELPPEMTGTSLVAGSNPTHGVG